VNHAPLDQQRESREIEISPLECNDLAISLEQISREITRLDRSRQALFALVDSLTKILLTCISEPHGHAFGFGRESQPCDASAVHWLPRNRRSWSRNKRAAQSE
jgi:hypothetical protein